MLLEKFGIGIDIVDVERFSSKQFSENKDFYRKIFNNSEIQYCLKFKNPYPHFAGKFALKEAVIKALNKKINFLNIDTLHESGSPKIQLKTYENYSSKASLSHESNIAVAVVLIEFLV